MWGYYDSELKRTIPNLKITYSPKYNSKNAIFSIQIFKKIIRIKLKNFLYLR